MDLLDKERARVSDAAYEAALVEFANATKEMDFSGSSKEPRFDDNYWNCHLMIQLPGTGLTLEVPFTRLNWTIARKRGCDIELQYTLKAGVSPARAVRQIAAHPSRWAMDCVDYVVAALLYAECVAGGDEAFDAKYENVGTALRPEPMRMAQHDTPKLPARSLWYRDAQRKEFVSHSEGAAATGIRPRDGREEDALLKTVPLGTRVMWTTTHPDAVDEMVNENAIKIGDDLYAAHPLDNISGQSVRAELVVDSDKLTKRQRQAHILRHIFLSEIEWYDRR